MPAFPCVVGVSSLSGLQSQVAFLRVDAHHRRVSDEETLELFRPVGPRELARIRELEFHAFPPRLHGQPIFYPVLGETYARQIARDWNATRSDTGYRGFVTRFRVRAAFARRYEPQTVGGRQHQELWVPAEDLGEFNNNIVGEIEVVAFYRGGADTEPTEMPVASAE
jgi:hypothetical protein